MAAALHAQIGFRRSDQSQSSTLGQPTNGGPVLIYFLSETIHPQENRSRGTHFAKFLISNFLKGLTYSAMNRQPGAGARNDFALEHVLLCDLDSQSSLGEEKLMWTEGEEASSLQSSSTATLLLLLLLLLHLLLLHHHGPPHRAPNPWSGSQRRGIPGKTTSKNNTNTMSMITNINTKTHHPNTATGGQG